MLEVSHLSKVYRAKGGSEVRALDDVSLKFPERGMIFLLGKSGSGKSTLLNVAGGLDDPTTGEIIVKGRSSKDFSQGDFDSYRNTFVGFIFQEYNILNEFSVEDNIAIALELQGKPKDREAISKLLEEVDLLGYAKRKPNTLSGGQKQRIAIARALIKSPEIIMADEPTGALDSATGKQVFDTLKKLSRDKLVIIVSHDRDFAEQYADRIIELKDGKILSDVSKTEEERREISENLTAVGDTLTVKNGAELSDDDLTKIKEFLKDAKGNVVIASGERDVKTFREAARITEDGSREVFRDTDGKEIPTKVFSPEDSRFIRSKLPLKHAVKIGVSGLKTKPIRLAFTALLCTIAFVMFGVLSTMMLYDSNATLKQTLKDSSLDTMTLGKQYEITESFYDMGELMNEYSYTRDAYFTKEELSEIVAIYGSSSFGSVSYDASFNVQKSSKYWKSSVTGFAYLDSSNSLRSKIISGSYPRADDEILITTYMADVMINCKAYDAKTNEPIESETKLGVIGKYIRLNGTEYKIVGILEAPALPSKYDVLNVDGANTGYSLEYELEQELRGGYYSTVFVTYPTLEKVASSIGSNTMYELFYNKNLFVNIQNSDGEYEKLDPMNNGSYTAYSNIADQVNVMWFDSDKTLSDGEALIPLNSAYDILWNDINSAQDEHIEEFEEAKHSDEYQGVVNDILRRIARSDDMFEIINHEHIIRNWEWGGVENIDSEYYEYYLEWKDAYEDVLEKAPNYKLAKDTMKAMEELNNNGKFVYNQDGIGDFVPLTSAERQAHTSTVMNFLNGRSYDFNLKAQMFSHETIGVFGDVYRFKIAGIYVSNESIWQRNLLLTDTDNDKIWDVQKLSISWYSEFKTDYVKEEDAIYSSIIIPFDRSDASIDRILTIYNNKEFDENDTRMAIRCSLIDGFMTVDMMISQLSKIFLWVGIVMAAFAALLMSNFISVSISQKKREIGILRAVGARGIDVFKIFFSESFTIAAICTLISTVGSIVLCNVLNAEISATIGSSLFVFGILSIAMLIGIAVMTAIIATFLPVYNAAKKKPVESIRAL